MTDQGVAENASAFNHNSRMSSPDCEDTATCTAVAAATGKAGAHARST